MPSRSTMMPWSAPKPTTSSRRIYREAADRYGLNAPDLVADFTGCPRSMSMGLILASLHADRDVQLIGTRYDIAGRPTGSVFPLSVNYETMAGATPMPCLMTPTANCLSRATGHRRLQEGRTSWAVSPQQLAGNTTTLTWKAS